MKSKARATSKTKEREFREMICDFFDIAHTDAMTLMTIPDDHEFLAASTRGGALTDHAGS